MVVTAAASPPPCRVPWLGVWPATWMPGGHGVKAAAFPAGDDLWAAAEPCATAGECSGHGCPVSRGGREIRGSCRRVSIEAVVPRVGHLYSVSTGFSVASSTVQTTSASSRSGNSWKPSGFTPRAVNLIGVELNVSAVAPSAGAGWYMIV
jgi:hypothetical protein